MTRRRMRPSSRLTVLGLSKPNLATAVSLGIVLIVSLADTALAATVSPVIREKSVDHFSASASPAYFVWNRALPGHRGHGKTLAKRRGMHPIRVTPRGTFSVGAAVDGSTVVQAQGSGGDDTNLRLYHLGSGTITKPGPGVNSNWDEARPSISGRFLFFTRGLFSRQSEATPGRALILYDRATDTSTVLARARHHHHYLVSDQVNGDWAVWERCKVSEAGFTNCYVFRYRISTKQTVRVPSFGRQAISPSVTSDGTVYFILDGTADSWTCGDNAVIVRYPVGSPPSMIASLREGKDALGTFAFENAGSVTLYLDRFTCRVEDLDIFKLSNAETA